MSDAQIAIVLAAVLLIGVPIPLIVSWLREKKNDGVLAAQDLTRRLR